jgi:hypothetical protein
MRFLTALFLVLAIITVYVGMTSLSDRVGGAGEPMDPPRGELRILPDPEPTAPPATPPSKTEWIAACIETTTTCKCYHRDGTKADLELADCRSVAKLGHQLPAGY